MVCIIKKEQADVLDKIREWVFKSHNEASDLMKQFDKAFEKEQKDECGYPRVDDMNDHYLELLHCLGEVYKDIEDVRQEIYMKNAEDSKLSKKFHIFAI